MEGLIDLLADEPYRGRADLPRLADETELTDDELLHVSSALALLGFAQVAHGDITLTPLGAHYASASKPVRQEVFGQQALTHIPLITYIRHGLEQDPSGDLPKELFLRLLRFTLTPAEAERVLRVAIEWGRYGEIFEYNYTTGVIHLPEGDESAPPS